MIYFIAFLIFATGCLVGALIMQQFLDYHDKKRRKLLENWTKMLRHDNLQIIKGARIEFQNGMINSIAEAMQQEPFDEEEQEDDLFAFKDPNGNDDDEGGILH